jgi:hypothetical protein
MGGGSGVVKGVSEGKASAGEGEGERGSDALAGARLVGSTSNDLKVFLYRCAEP